MKGTGIGLKKIILHFQINKIVEFISTKVATDLASVVKAESERNFLC